MFHASLPVLSESLESDLSFAATRSDAYGAIAGQAIEESVTGFAGRALGRFLLSGSEENYLSPDAANEAFGIDGALSFSKPVSPYVAAQQYGIKQRELERSDILSRANIGTAETLGVALAASLLDPLGDALAFVPYAGASKLYNTARAGQKAMSLSRRIGRGAGEGAAAGLVVEGALYPLAQIEGRDYGAADSVFNVALSAGLGTVGRLIGDARVGNADAGETVSVLPEIPDFTDLPPDVRQSIFEDSVLAVANGEDVRAGELMALARADNEGDFVPDADGGAVIDEADISAAAIESRARQDSLLQYLDDESDLDGDLSFIGGSSSDPALSVIARHSAATARTLRGGTARDFEAEGTDVQNRETQVTETDAATGEAAEGGGPKISVRVDPVLKAETEAVFQDLAALVENGRLSAKEVEALDDVAETARLSKVPDLYEAAAFCLAVEGAL
jgi:hypothetical protein